MANKRLIDANSCPALFDEAFKETRQLILQGETHLDNLAEGFTEAYRVIQAMPTVDAVEVVHGWWVASGQCNHKPYRMRSPDHWTTYKCSVCGFRNGRRHNDNYCPNCGANMDGKGEGE